MKKKFYKCELQTPTGNTCVKLVLGCKLIPLPSRFLATTALISSSKPLQQYNSAGVMYSTERKIDTNKN